MEPNFTIEAGEERVTKQKLIHDLKVVAQDAEELMKATASDLGEKARAARAKLAATLESAKATGKRLEEKTLATAKAADHVIREHPYRTMGVAFAIGVVIGVLVNRK